MWHIQHLPHTQTRSWYFFCRYIFSLHSRVWTCICACSGSLCSCCCPSVQQTFLTDTGFPHIQLYSDISLYFLSLLLIFYSLLIPIFIAVSYWETSFLSYQTICRIHYSRSFFLISILNESASFPALKKTPIKLAMNVISCIIAVVALILFFLVLHNFSSF